MTAPASPPPDGGTPDLLPHPDVLPVLGPDTRGPWRIRLHEVIFGHHTPAGRDFDVRLILATAVSVTVVTLVIVLGSLMYTVEGGQRGFDSIPRSVYWAVVTLTTVGYGDLAPQTGGGQATAMVIKLLGCGTIAVPTEGLTPGERRALARRLLESP